MFRLSHWAKLVNIILLHSTEKSSFDLLMVLCSLLNFGVVIWIWWFKLICAMEKYLQLKIMQVYKNVLFQNEYRSSKLCEALYTRCEDLMDQLQVLRLPSMAKFNAGLQKCNTSFELECVGPSKTNYERRMIKVGHVNSVFSFFYWYFWGILFVIPFSCLYFTLNIGIPGP